MKFCQTEFASQMFAAVIGTLFLVACVAFATLPSTLGCAHGGSGECAAATSEWHLT
jgi:hypothetical protein